MPDDPINEISERLNRALTMTQPNTASSSAGLTGLNEVQKEQIKKLITDIVGTGNDIPTDEGTDQPVGRVTGNLDELNKVPDLVKSIREFSGKPGEFNSWRKSVDRVLELFETFRGTGRYYAILHTIRTKIIGEADMALESYRTPLDWVRIKKCLMMHYSDKRDIGTLEYQMTVLCQGNRTINEFYQAVYQHLSLILDKVSCLDLHETSLRAMTNTYREKALDTFIRGLNGDLPRLLSIREPTSLPQALHICLKLDNMTFRRNYAHAQIPKANVQKDKVGPTISLNGRKFYPELAHTGAIRPPVPPRYNPGMNFNPTYNNQNSNVMQSNYRNWNPKPHFNSGTQNGFLGQWNRPQHFNESNNYQKSSVVEPMEVDRSIQTKQVNYTNQAPINQNTKRSAGNSIQGPINKIQRNFHVDTEYMPDEYYWWGCPPEANEVDYPPQNGEPGYLREYSQQIPEEEAALENQEDQPDDVQLVVNFLD